MRASLPTANSRTRYRLTRDSGLNQVKSANELRRLKEVRDMFTHRYFPRHLTIGAAFDHEFDLDGKRIRFGDLVEEFRAFVIDRLVALAAIYETP